MFQDVRYATRVLLQGKGWSALVVLSLALGIGANTALFSATSALLLRTLPVEDPGTLVRLRHLGRNQMANNIQEYGNVRRSPDDAAGSTFSYAVFEQLRAANATLASLVAGAPLGSVNIIVNGEAEIGSAYLASGAYHQTLGIAALRGRTLLPGDDDPAAPPVAVISEGYWQRRFGGAADVLGTVVSVNDTPVTIVGITPLAFTGVQRVVGDGPDLTLPLALDRRMTLPQPMYQGGPEASRFDQPTYWWLQVFGRLKPGATPAQVEGNLGGPFQAAARAGMTTFLGSLPADQRGTTYNRDRTQVSSLSVSSMARGLYDSDAATLRGVAIISGVVGLILLLVCANVANLLLSRAAARQKEIAIRLSIGATRARLIRQLLTESVLLSAAGATLGLLVGYWGRRLLPGAAGQGPLDWRVLLFTAAIAVVTGVVFGLAPALRVTQDAAGEALKDASRSIAGTRALLPKVLLVLQVAISLTLLVGAGLFLQTVANLRQVDVGFDADNLVVFRVNPRLNRYEGPRALALYDQLLTRLSGTPGLRSVTISNPSLLAGGVNSTTFLVQGRQYSPAVLEARDEVSIHRMTVAPSFFATMGIPVRRGRTLEDRDRDPARRVAVLNEAAVRKFFPREDPIGQRFGNSPETSGQIEIVGVVADTKYSEVREEPPPTIFVPYEQYPPGAMTVVARTMGAPTSVIPAIREAVRQVDASLPIMDLSTQVEQIERRFAQEKVFAQAYTLFGGLALLVAAIGIFGLMSYTVTRRTTEIGVRMALGAERRMVLQMILRESLVVAVIGVALGAAVAALGGRVLASSLYGLESTDVPTALGAVVVMLTVSTLAGYVPARRAARLTPMQALRHD